jgi:hypothetical protein
MIDASMNFDSCQAITRAYDIKLRILDVRKFFHRLSARSATSSFVVATGQQGLWHRTAAHLRRVECVRDGQEDGGQTEDVGA